MTRAATVRVSAKWNSVSDGRGAETGLYVEQGQLLVIHADASDTWSLGSGRRTCNANGLGNPLGQDFGVYSLGDFECVYGALVGSLNQGQTFFGIGTYLVMTALLSGDLTLYCWDSNSNDNDGEITAYIQVYDALQP